MKLMNMGQTEKPESVSDLHNMIKELQFEKWELENALNRIMQTHECPRNAKRFIDRNKNIEEVVYVSVCMICGDTL